MFKVTTKQEPVSLSPTQTTTTVTRRLPSPVNGMSYTLLAKQTATGTSSNTATQFSTSNGTATSPTYLPEEAGVQKINSAPNSISLTVTIMVIMAIILVGALTIVVTYVICRMLRRPVDLFSTSADVFEMTFLSNE